MLSEPAGGGESKHPEEINLTMQVSGSSYKIDFSGRRENASILQRKGKIIGVLRLRTRSSVTRAALRMTMFRELSQAHRAWWKAVLAKGQRLKAKGSSR